MIKFKTEKKEKNKMIQVGKMYTWYLECAMSEIWMNIFVSLHDKFTRCGTFSLCTLVKANTSTMKVFSVL